MSQFRFTVDCTDQCELKIEPVPGAKHYPRRTICPIHGWPREARSGFTSQSELDRDRPNDYVSEIASPADVIEIGGKEVSLY